MKKGWIALIIVIILVIIGWYWYMKMYTAPAGNTNQATTPTAAVKGQVSIMNNSFVPDPENIKVGDTVTWVNNDSYNHQLASDNGVFSGPTMTPGSTYSFTFTAAGTYPYSCVIHTFMHGTIIVTK